MIAGLVLCLLLAPTASLASANDLVVVAPQEVDGTPGWSARKICRASAEPGAAFSCQNWAGTVAWTPASVFSPASEAELADYLAHGAAAAAAAGSSQQRPAMKVVGFAHSWAGLYATSGVTLALHKLSGITRLTDTEVEVLSGTSFARLFAELEAEGKTLAWSPGGIQGLTVGGAVSVGFHGSQMSVGGVSSVVRSLRLYDTAGNPHELTDATHPEAMKAARMGLGMCGIIGRVTLPVVPQFHLRRRRWQVAADDFLDAQLPELKATYDRFHWYLHPATASAWPMYWEPATAAESAAEGRPCRTALEQHEDAAMKEFGVDGLPLIMRWDNCSDISYRSLTHAVDMEAQPLWNGEYYVNLPAAGEAAATRDILAGFQRVAEARGEAAPSPHLWLHVRYVGGDKDSFLNPAYGDGVFAAFELALVAPAMDAPLPPWEEWAAYFGEMERVLRALGGRPHHAKFYSSLPPSEPAFGLPVDRFRAACAAFDPDRLLRNDAFDRLFQVEAAGNDGAVGGGAGSTSEE